MPREFQQDGDVSFGGFQSYPNSAGFDPEKGILEYCSNMRINEGVLTRRMGLHKFYNHSGGNVLYAAASQGAQDYIYLWHSNDLHRVCTTNYNGLETLSPGARAYRQVRGQGYANLASVEAATVGTWTGDYDFTDATNFLGRTAYCRDDQVWFSLFGGIQPFNADTVSLIQGTYDSAQALHYSYFGRKLYCFGKRSVYEIEPAITAMALETGQPDESFFHKVKRLTASEGVLAKDSVAEVMGRVFYLGTDGIHMIDVAQGMLEGQTPLSMPVNDLFSGIPAADLQKAVGVSFKGRYYLLMPNQTNHKLDRVLVVDPTLPGLFESIDTYHVEMASIVVARNSDRVPCLWAVGKNGHIYQMEVDSTDDGTAYQGVFRTRNYSFRSEMDKRYDAVMLRLNTNGAAHLDVNFKTQNPDGTHLIDTLNGNAGSTVRRALAGKKCSGCNVEVIVKSGFPTFYSVMVDGSLAGRSIFNVF